MTVFDFDHFLRIPRLSGLRLSPDGRRLVVCVARPNAEGKAFVSALWQLDVGGQAPPRRLTRSGPGEGVATFRRDGAMLFTSARLDEDATKEAREARGEAPGLWLLPAEGGEARLLLGPPGGVDAVRAAAAADVLAFGVGVDTNSADVAGDAQRAKARHDAGVSALLFDSFPIRYWDRYLGPRQRHLLSATLPTAGQEGPLADSTDLLPEPRGRLLEVDFDLLPDGTAVVSGIVNEEVLTRPRVDLVRIDRATGSQRVLAESDGAMHSHVRCSPDGRWAVCLRSTLGDREHAEQNIVWLVDVTSGDGRPLSDALADVWTHELAWSPDSSAVFVAGDRDGRAPAYRVELADGAVTRLSADGAYSDLQPTPDGAGLFALCSTYLRPPHPVRLDARQPDQQPRELPFPGLGEAEVAAPGVLERLEATAADGVRVPAWLVRPAGASADQPVPLVTFIHGGPIGSWNSWHWRWNPQLLVERGYAVLMPDPAISTGYGQAYVDRGWGRWGEAPYTDLMAAVEAALTRDDLDATRTAAMGGSFGGYMANWVAGHTDRFKGIVSHASLWELRGFHGSTDNGPWWESEFGDPYLDASRYEAASPHRFVADIRTPMLVIHGELDYRVPISEALRLWTDLRRHDVPARFLYFPDENHWVLKPQNARLWYAAVLAFLDETVLGRPWQRPELV